jgi:hypothetical protein
LRTDTSNRFHLDVYNGGGGGQLSAFTVAQNGHVGIGISSPGQRLAVGNPSSGDSLYAVNANSSGYAGYFHNVDSGGNVYVKLAGATGTNVAAMFMNGRVGVGTTSPSQALHVNGSIRVDALASASATALCINASVLSTCSSSIRYKEQVKDASFGLKEIGRMRPVTFKWRDRDGLDFGLIAEEVAAINPLFVTHKNGRIEGVKYAQLTAVLIGALKQQQAKIATLEARNTGLEARLHRLELRAQLQVVRK